MKKNFKIEHLDSMAQGVSKINGDIIFIPRTLPGEEGDCEITAKKGRVSFARLDTLEKESELRNESKCEHYQSCGGCDYLHTSYEVEVNFKTSALEDIFKRGHRFENIPAITTIKADSRFNYRNRIQLHYDKKLKSLGFKALNNKIIKVQHCLLPQDELSNELKSLYENDSWLNLVKKHKTRGHIEIYHKNGEIEISINKHYSAGGFSQVNQEMNSKLQALLEDYFQESNSEIIIDLFGGEGNITKTARAKKIYVIDSTDNKFINLQNPSQSYFKVNLYERDALEELRKVGLETGQLLVLDPPRSGLKDIDAFTQELEPNSILYVSCNPQTLARDIKKIEDRYQLESLYLIDFFPGTKHFETVAIMQRK